MMEEISLINTMSASRYSMLVFSRTIYWFYVVLLAAITTTTFDFCNFAISKRSEMHNNMTQENVPQCYRIRII